MFWSNNFLPLHGGYKTHYIKSLCTCHFYPFWLIKVCNLWTGPWAKKPRKRSICTLFSHTSLTGPGLTLTKFILIMIPLQGKIWNSPLPPTSLSSLLCTETFLIVDIDPIFGDNTYEFVQTQTHKDMNSFLLPTYPITHFSLVDPCHFSSA